MSGEQVLLFLENVRERLHVVTLTADEYYTALKQVSAAAGIVGGTIYDALLGADAPMKAKTEYIY